MVARPVSVPLLYGLLLMGMFSRLEEGDRISSFGFDSMMVRLGRGRRRVKVAMDGEIFWMRAPLEFRVCPQRLPLLVARDEAMGAGV